MGDDRSLTRRHAWPEAGLISSRLSTATNSPGSTSSSARRAGRLNGPGASSTTDAVRPRFRALRNHGTKEEAVAAVRDQWALAREWSAETSKALITGRAAAGCGDLRRKKARLWAAGLGASSRRNRRAQSPRQRNSLCDGVPGGAGGALKGAQDTLQLPRRLAFWARPMHAWAVSGAIAHGGEGSDLIGRGG